MRIGSKLFLTFSALILAGTFVGGVGLFHLTQVQSFQKSASTEAIPSMEALLGATQDYLKMRVVIRDLVYTEDPARVLEFRKTLYALDDSFREHLKAFRTASGTDRDQGELRRLMEGMGSTYEAYLQILEDLYRLVSRGERAQAIELMYGTGAQRAAAMSQLMDGLAARTKEKVAGQTLDANKVVTQAMVLTLGLLALSAVGGFTVALVMARSLARPIRRVSGLARQVADRDLTVRGTGTATRRKDEVGDLGRAVDAMAEGLHEFVVGLNQMGTAIDQSARSLDTKAAEMAQAAARITEAARRGHHSAQSQAAGVTETTATVVQIASTIEKFDRLIEDQAASVTQTTAALEEMASNIRSLSAQAGRLQEVSKELRSSSADGRDKLFAMLDKIESMAVQSKKLTEANAAIRTVAAQTKMLSLNAAIEAAHAGDAGAGFAVVAAEIGTLSEKAAQGTREITQEIRVIQQLIAQTVEDSETGKRAFGAILGKVDELGRFEAELSGALQEQSVGASQILEATTRVSTVTSEVRNGSLEILQGSQVIRGEMEVLLGHSRQLEADLNGVEAEGHSIGGASAQVLDHAAQNRQLSGKLDEVLGTFRI